MGLIEKARSRAKELKENMLMPAAFVLLNAEQRAKVNDTAELLLDMATALESGGR